MDFKKIIDAARIPLLILAVLWILNQSLTMFGWIFGLETLSNLRLLITILNIFAYLLAGYTATKIYKLDLVNAGLVGAFMAVVWNIIEFILNMMLKYSLVEANGGVIAWIFTNILLTIILWIVFAIGAFVVSLVGGVLGQKF